MATNIWEIPYSDPASLNTIPVYPNNIDKTTSVELIGQNAQGYGPALNRNFLHLLENFASPTPPTNPITGQLWYDKSSSVFRYGQLKVHDGGAWGPTNGVWIQDQDPLVTAGNNQRSPVLGELWIETVGMQLSIFNGQSWALVGPPTPANIDVQSGSFAESIIDAVDGITTRYVIKNYINGEVVSIIADTTFTPQAVIPGFSTLQPGINLNSVLTNTAFHGVATAASSLYISGNNIPSSNFFRTDQDQIFSHNFTINNDSGIYIGAINPTLHLSKSGSNVVLSNLIEGANIVFSTMRSNTLDNILIVNGTSRAVSILSTSTTPSATLDVTGSLHISSTSTLAGSVSVGGNIAVGGNINVSGLATFNTSTFAKNINSGDIIPTISSTSSLGSSTHRFKDIYVDNIHSNNTMFDGTSAYAQALTATTVFTISGAIRSSGAPVQFNGTQNVTLTTVVTTSSIMLQATTSTALSTDFIAISNNSNLNKIAKSDFLSDVTSKLNPIGTVVAFATILTPPAGWLLCNGASVSTSTYSALFAVIGTNFGGSGSTFKVPNIEDLVTGTLKYIIKY